MVGGHLLPFIAWVSIILLDDSTGSTFSAPVINSVAFRKIQNPPSFVHHLQPPFQEDSIAETNHLQPFQEDSIAETSADDDSFPYFSLEVTDRQHPAFIPRGGAINSNARPDLLERADDKTDKMLERMPKRCSLVNFHDSAEILEKRAGFIRDMFSPKSQYYRFIRRSVDPLALEFPFQKIFKLKLPIIGGYRAKVTIDEAKVRSFVPSDIQLVPVPGFKQKLDVTVKFPTLALEYDYDVEFRKSLFGYREKPKHGKLRLSAKIKNPVFKMRIRAACVECQGNVLSRFQKYAGYAAHVGKGFLSRGVTGMKEASMIAIYDADVEDVEVSFESGNINDVVITNIPQKGQDIGELERQVPGLSENLKNAANFLYNGILKQDLQKSSADGMKRDTKVKIDAMRPHFFRSYLEKQNKRRFRIRL